MGALVTCIFVRARVHACMRVFVRVWQHARKLVRFTPLAVILFRFVIIDVILFRFVIIAVYPGSPIQQLPASPKLPPHICSPPHHIMHLQPSS